LRLYGTHPDDNSPRREITYRNPSIAGRRTRDGLAIATGGETKRNDLIRFDSRRQSAARLQRFRSGSQLR